MAHEYFQEGEAVDFTNNTGAAIPAGAVVFDANGYTLLGISARPIAIGESSSLIREQGAIFNLDKVSADAFAVGDNVNFNISLNQATKSPVVAGSIVALGKCVEAAAASTLKVKTTIDFSQGRRSEQLAHSIRFRATIAQVNAGVTVLPALPGFKYVVRDIKMIAVGGAVTAATSVDVLATQGASSVKLLSVAVAALTQSAVNRSGGSNASVLADGASFVANDVNTAITLAKTGSAAATATNVDVIIDYAIEAA